MNIWYFYWKRGFGWHAKMFEGPELAVLRTWSAKAGHSLMQLKGFTVVAPLPQTRLPPATQLPEFRNWLPMQIALCRRQPVPDTTKPSSQAEQT
jgi:hypothetical protein